MFFVIDWEFLIFFVSYTNVLLILRQIFLDRYDQWLYNINEFGSNTCSFLMCYVLVTY